MRQNDLTVASKEGNWRKGVLQGHKGGVGEHQPRFVCVKHTGSECPVKLNEVCRAHWKPVLAGRLTLSDLPLCTSLSRLGCQGTVNLSLPEP